MASLASKTSAKSKREVNPEHLDIVRAILEDIFEGITPPEGEEADEEAREDCYKV